MSPVLAVEIALPPDFRTDDVRALHGRDAQEIAERLTPEGFVKGLAWDGAPALLTLRFDGASAEARLAVDGDAGADAADRLSAMARRMLGLTQKIEAFEARHADHPLIGPLIARRPGLRVPLTATPFEALSWAIVGQMISVEAAMAMRRKVVLAAGLRHSSGLACQPDAAALSALPEEALRAAGLSRAKTATLKALAGRLAAGPELPETWDGEPPVAAIRERLAGIRGIGPWTVGYALLRGFGWLDGALHGDVAVRRNLQILLRRDDRLTEAETEAWLAPFSPWRALVAAHLWAMRRDAGY
jgi:DNA-3-methyladenine glycosylase II